jgi:hypothetical protein
LAAAKIRSLANGESGKSWLPIRLAHLASEVPNSQWCEYGVTQIRALRSLAEARQYLNMLTAI